MFVILKIWGVILPCHVRKKHICADEGSVALHPPISRNRAKYVNQNKGDRLSGCFVIMKKWNRVVNQREQAVIIFTRDEFPMMKRQEIQ